jgi:branched-chain amino acid transport system permease protein
MIPRATPATVTIPAATMRSLLPVLVGIGAALLIHFAVPTHGYAARIVFAIGINVILAVSLNIVNGFTGQFSMGHAGFMAVGAYASIVITYYGGYALFGTVDKNDAFSGYLLFFGSILVGGIMAAIAGYLVGLPSLRLRGDYLAIVTLGFGEIIRVLVQVSRDSLDPGMIETVAWWKRPIYLGGSLGFIHGGSYNNLAWTWAGVAVTLMVAYRLRQSTHGRAFLSVRENEIAAEAVGINTTRYKVNAFVLAAFFAGVAGALFAHQNGAGTASRPEEFNFMKSFDAIIMVVLGGMGSISGATLAAIALTVLTEALRSFAEYRLISYALLLILVMILRPKGLFGTEEIWEVAPRIWRRFRGKK